MPRLIPLKQWAVEMFGDEHKPHENTLHRWVHEGKIRPHPKKVGNRFFVDPKAEYVDADAAMLEKML